MSLTDRTYGAPTCRQGYIWRGAKPDDKLCVAPSVRDQARRDKTIKVERSTLIPFRSLKALTKRINAPDLLED